MPPPLILDIQAVQDNLYYERGIARYVRNLAGALLARGDAVCRVTLNPLLPGPVSLPPDLKMSPRLIWNTAEEWRRAQAEGGRCYLNMSPFHQLLSNFEMTLPPPGVQADIAIGVILYDLIPLVFQRRYLRHPSIRKAYLTRLNWIKGADFILAISEFTRRDAIRYLRIDPAKIWAIGGGVEDKFVPGEAGPLPADRSLLPPGILGDYIFTVLGDDPRKNLETLIRAYAALPNKLRGKLQLVVGGHYEQNTLTTHQRTAADLGLVKKELVFPGKVDDRRLVNLYQQASLFVFPSMYEGFGLPVLEAAACGCPVISSNTTSLPEILDWPPSTFDPDRGEDLTALMTRALSDPGFRSDLLAAGRRAVRRHHWTRVAERTMQAVNHLSERRKRRGKKTPVPRLALVGPMPPERTGVGDYNAQLVADLTARCHLDLFTNVALPKDLFPGENLRRFPVKALGRVKNPYTYDRILYTIGNSEHYYDIREAAVAYPGIVWLHDVFLAGLYCYYAEERLASPSRFHFVNNLLNQFYPARFPVNEGGAYLLEPEYYRKRDVYFSAELVSRSKGVIVHSPAARDLVIRDTGPHQPSVPIHVLYLGFKISHPVLPIEKPTSETWIATFGLQDPVKHPLTLLRAFSTLAARHPDLRLAFVGPMPQSLISEIETTARKLGCLDRLVITGYLPTEPFQECMLRTRLAVQLRSVFHGESSGVIHHCLALGTPVITNLPAHAHWPDSVIVKLPYSFTEEQLTEAIDFHLVHSEKRAALADHGREFARQHSLKHLIHDLFQRLELH